MSAQAGSAPGDVRSDRTVAERLPIPLLDLRRPRKMDVELFDYSPIVHPAPIQWPGARTAFYVGVNVEHFRRPMTHFTVQAADPDGGQETLWGDRVSDRAYAGEV
jgi:hypothetical protein